MVAATAMETAMATEMAMVTATITMLVLTTATRMICPGCALWQKTTPLPWPATTTITPMRKCGGGGGSGGCGKLEELSAIVDVLSDAMKIAMLQLLEGIGTK